MEWSSFAIGSLKFMQSLLDNGFVFKRINFTDQEQISSNFSIMAMKVKLQGQQIGTKVAKELFRSQINLSMTESKRYMNKKIESAKC